MENLKLCDSDYRFMLVVWEAAPVNSGELVRLCQEQLGWKKSTTYTQIKKMCEKGYIERTFDGSLPAFLTAFLGGKTITEHEAEKIKKMIDEHIG